MSDFTPPREVNSPDEVDRPFTDQSVSEPIVVEAVEVSIEAPGTVIPPQEDTGEILEPVAAGEDETTPTPETEIEQSDQSAEEEVKKLKVRTTKGTPRPSKVEEAEEPAKAKKGKTPREKAPKEKAVKEKTKKAASVSRLPQIADMEQEEGYVPGSRKKWYVLKVQVNREDAIKESLKRRAAIAGYDVYFGDILIPNEKVTEVRGGKKRIVKKKLYPGYLMIFMEITEETWFMVRETPGIGDFTGASGRPTPMLEHEIQAMLHNAEDTEAAESPKLKIGFQIGDKIKIKEGTFENFEGEVHQIDAGSGRVTVMINIFGRSTPVELEYWQLETPS